MALLTRPRGFVAWLLGIAAAAVAIRVAFLLGVDPQVPRVSDSNAYHLLANHLADGRGYIRPFDFADFGLVHVTAEYPPLFPALLSVISVLGATSIEAHRLLTCLLGGGTVVLVGLLGRRVRGDTVGLVAAGIAAIYPVLFVTDTMLMTESLYVLIVTGALLLAFWAADEPSLGRFAVLGAVLGIGALTRTEALLLAVVLVIPLALRLRGRSLGSRVALAAVALFVTGAVVLPWTIRNAVEFDRLIPVSNTMVFVFDGANCPPVYSGPDIGLWKPALGGLKGLPRDECFEGFDIKKRSFDEGVEAQRHADDGLQYARDHLDRLPVVLPVRWLRTFGAYDPGGQLDFEAFFEGRPRDWIAAGLVFYWLLVPFAILGFIALWRARARVWPLAAPFVAVTIGTLLSYGNTRFRIAAEPALVVLASIAIVAIVRRLAARRSGGPGTGDQVPPSAGPTNTAAG